eukprot:TRINITY_DN78_c3_g2_i1.p1 TRINITY_DN78_c3_g2~~TRINITY_DN78_c3_g2_i1.p1  ORF type:complete len:681 (+),score=234.87 TRINITY_DN78_c3_g2_i1:238-2043(+)
MAAIMGDLQGPKFRFGVFENNSARVKAGDTVLVVTSKKHQLGNAKIMCTGTAHADVVVTELKVGQRILIDDGAVVFKMTKRVSSEEIECVVIVGGEVKNHKSMNVPDLLVSVPALTDKDTIDAKFILDAHLDFVALSFVQRASDVVQLRTFMQKNQAEKDRNDPELKIPKIISKIEKPQAIDSIDDIIAVSDGIMVARGDLGVECALEQVPALQKMLIDKCTIARVPVITATQMLESMTKSLVPTRAEVSDVFNAVFDGSDAVMLSGETAMGDFPVETVQMMTRTVRTAELTLSLQSHRSSHMTQLMTKAALFHSHRRHYHEIEYSIPSAPSTSTSTSTSSTSSLSSLSSSSFSSSSSPLLSLSPTLSLSTTQQQRGEIEKIENAFDARKLHHGIALSSAIAAASLQAKAIVLLALTYDTGLYLSKIRCNVPIIVLTLSPRLARLFCLCYSTLPVRMDLLKMSKETTNSDDFIIEMEKCLLATNTISNWFKEGDLYVLCSGVCPLPGLAHSMQINVLGKASQVREKSRSSSSSSSVSSSTTSTQNNNNNTIDKETTWKSPTDELIQTLMTWGEKSEANTSPSSSSSCTCSSSSTSTGLSKS